LLLGASLIGLAAVTPYMLVLAGDALRHVPLPLSVVLAVQFAQSTMLYGLAVGLGLLVSRKLGLGAPVLEAWLYNRGNFFVPRIFALSAVAGAVTGVVIMGIAHLLFSGVITPLLGQEGAIPLWKRLLACFYGALNEEILMRLFLLSLFLWLLGKVWRTSQGQPSRGAFWTANLLVALLFGLAHIPAAALMMQINTTVIVYILSLNGLAALLFGYLFWRHGLESAMTAHLFADIVLVAVQTIP
jgi:membrane protease YdiL (CAAX protease family)